MHKRKQHQGETHRVRQVQVKHFGAQLAIRLQAACRMHLLRRSSTLYGYGVQETSHRTTTVQIHDEMIYSTVQLYTRDLRSYRCKVTGEGSPPSVGGTACDGTDHGHAICVCEYL